MQILKILICFMFILGLAACEDMRGRDIGTIAGAGAGAAVGGAISGGAGGAAVGAVAGGIGGHYIGKGMEKDKSK